MTTALLLDILDKHLKEAQTIYIAGWSSPVARRAHNPKVVSSNLAPSTIYDYAVSFVAGGVVRFYFLHKRHISIPFGPISRGTDANEVFVYVHTKNIFAQRLLGAVRVFL